MNKTETKLTQDTDGAIIVDGVRAIIYTEYEQAPETRRLLDELLRRYNSHAELLAALAKSRQRIDNLCSMVNDFSVRLGDTQRKVRAEDWTDKADAAIAKAQ